MQTPKEVFHDLLSVIQILRSGDGCPWDREQTMETIQEYLKQEFSELKKALDKKSPEETREEMGDVLFLLLFMGEIARDEGYFTIEDVLEGAKEKLIRRHPHVFGDVTTDDISEIKQNWKEIKAQEKLLLSRQSLVEKVPRHLSPLLQALWVIRKAGEEGWLNGEDPVSVVGQMQDSIQKTHDLIDQGAQDKVTHQLGELFIHLVLLCRLLEVNPETALKGSLSRLAERLTDNEPAPAKQETCVKEAIQNQRGYPRGECGPEEN